MNYIEGPSHFAVHFYPGEDNERLPEWRVMEWAMSPKYNCHFGYTVWYTYDMEMGEEMAKAECARLTEKAGLETEESI